MSYNVNDGILGGSLSMSNFDQLKCRVCQNGDDNRTYTVKEMMFGYRDNFEYFQCSHCGCLQIKEIPDNMEKYYPSNYWGKPKNILDKKDRSLKSWLKLQRTKYLLESPNIVGKLVSSYTAIGNAPVWSGWDWIGDFKRINIGINSAILDVGCGVGSLLYYLREQGFSNLTGVEPYAPRNTLVEGVTIYNKELKNIEKQFDFITLHHSFEHMAEPYEVFKQLYRLLNPQRYLLLRIPVVSSWAWEKYQVNWVQLDAPRHFFLHTPDSIQVLCEKTGFQLSHIVYDSNEFQFWASEQYLKDIPLRESNSVNFSSEEIESFKRKAKELNQEHRGDQACFYLYKP